MYRLLLIPLFPFIFLALEISSQPLISCFSPSSHREEDGTESLSTTTHEPTESDDADQDKLLLSPSAGNSEVSFVKEVQRWYQTSFLKLISWQGVRKKILSSLMYIFCCVHWTHCLYALLFARFAVILFPVSSSPFTFLFVQFDLLFWSEESGGR